MTVASAARQGGRNRMHETFDHTADLGLRIRAPDLNGLFAEAGEALFETIVENRGDVRPTAPLTVDKQAAALEYLLFDWLNELLYAFEHERWLGARFAVEVRPSSQGWSLHAEAFGEAADPDRHRLDHEVKAITYHGLKAERQPDGSWLAEVILDI